jgi:hypothetical protein
MIHDFAQQLASPFPLLAAVSARTRKIEIGTAVIDMRYENPHYMAEDAGAADLIYGGRLQLGISRGSIDDLLGFAPFAQPGRKLVTRVLRAFLLAAVFLPCSMTVIVAISDEARRKKKTKSGSLTKTHGRSSAAATLLSQRFLSSILGKTRRSRRPTRCC